MFVLCSLRALLIRLLACFFRMRAYAGDDGVPHWTEMASVLCLRSSVFAALSSLSYNLTQCATE